MTRAREHKQAVALTYGDPDGTYADRRAMQSGNFSRLDELVRATGWSAGGGVVVDLGCGPGDVTGQVRDGAGDGRGLVVGVDFALRQLVYARHAHPTCRFVAADVELMALRDGSVDVVVSNSVLHWLNAPEHGQTVEPALAEIARVLVPGGHLCASIAGRGTAARFRRAFHLVAERHRSEGRLDEAAFRHDPVGCMQLHEVVDHVQAAGLRPVRASIEYEPVEYAAAAAYAADVSAYGLGPYTAAFPEEDREAVFAEITRQFEQDVGPGPYLHDQYMVYILATRP